jgi:hypothetical protein
LVLIIISFVLLACSFITSIIILNIFMFSEPLSFACLAKSPGSSEIIPSADFMSSFLSYSIILETCSCHSRGLRWLLLVRVVVLA